MPTVLPVRYSDISGLSLSFALERLDASTYYDFVAKTFGVVTLGGTLSTQALTELTAGNYTYDLADVLTDGDYRVLILSGGVTIATAGGVIYNGSFATPPPGGGGSGGTDWTTSERNQIRYQLGLDGISQAPLSGTPHLAPTVAQVRADLDANSTKLALLDATLSSRLATAGYTAPDNTTLAHLAGGLAADGSGGYQWTARALALAPAGSGIPRNQALPGFAFLMVATADHISPATGKAITAQRSIDKGAFAPCTNTPVEIGSGIYAIDLSASDTNGTVITLRFSATGTDDRFVTLITI